MQKKTQNKKVVEKKKTTTKAVGKKKFQYNSIVNQHHTLVRADGILKIQHSYELINVTLGWLTPYDEHEPSVTLVMPKSFAKVLATELQKAIK